MTFIVQKRHNLILDQLDREEAVSIKDLSDLLEASRETVRKDIAVLSGKGRLKQVRGGAVRIQSHEAALKERAVVNPEGKRGIARAVAALIPDGASLIIDSGTTTQAAARELAARRAGLSICTNDLTIAAILAPMAREILILGGVLFPRENYTLGMDTLDMLGRYRADFGLVGVGGLSEDGLFTDFSREGVALRDKMIEVSSHSILLADRSKIGIVAPVRLTRAHDADRLVTDKALADDMLSALESKGMQVDVA